MLHYSAEWFIGLVLEILKSSPSCPPFGLWVLEGPLIMCLEPVFLWGFDTEFWRVPFLAAKSIELLMIFWPNYWQSEFHHPTEQYSFYMKLPLVSVIENLNFEVPILLLLFRQLCKLGGIHFCMNDLYRQNHVKKQKALKCLDNFLAKKNLAHQLFPVKESSPSPCPTGTGPPKFLKFCLFNWNWTSWIISIHQPSQL